MAPYVKITSSCIADGVPHKASEKAVNLSDAAAKTIVGFGLGEYANAPAASAREAEPVKPDADAPPSLTSLKQAELKALLAEPERAARVKALGLTIPKSPSNKDLIALIEAADASVATDDEDEGIEIPDDLASLPDDELRGLAERLEIEVAAGATREDILAAIEALIETNEEPAA